jgi:hypothetical protein
MGTMRFRVFPPERITAEMVQQAYLAGIDRVSWPVRASVEGEELVLQRSVSDSANLHVPWWVEGHGLLTLASPSLIERAEPYHLPLELARGTVVQVRNQLSDWQMIGLAVSEAVHAKLATAVERLSWAAVEQEDAAASAAHAEASLRAALEAANLLTAAYAEQAIVVRRRNEGAHFGLLAGDLTTTLLDDQTARQFLRSFNAAELPICWRETETTEGHMTWVVNDKQVEWCHKHRLKILAGPLLLLAPQALPDWLLLFEDDFESVLECASAFIRAAVERYRGKVDYWICAGRVNAAEVLALSEHERLRLVARTVELVRSLDPDTPVLVSFDQPWAEYMRQQHSDFPAVQFADALVRAGLDLGGLMMEINVSHQPGGTLPRHILELSRQLDEWGRLGLPLWLSVSAPSADHDDPLAQRRTAMPPGGWTPLAQQRWAARFVPSALAKRSVRGVIWNQLCDSTPHDFPHAGLFDADGQAKPVLRTLAAIRKTRLS